MHIGIVSEYQRPWVGGIPEHVHHEARELRARGHRVTCITGPGDDEEDKGVVRLGREIVFQSNGARSRAVVGPYLFRFRRRLASLGLDVLHVHAPTEPVLGLSATLASPVPVVGTFHASFRPARLWRALYEWGRPLTGRAMDRIAVRVAVSEEAERSIAHYFPGAFRRIPNGVDTERFHPRVPPHPSLVGGQPRVLFVGRPDPRKGLSLLLDAHKMLLGTELVLVGVTPEDLGQPLDGVRAVGHVSPAELPGYVSGCDVFCSPARYGESQGIVLLEAMASGKMPVCFDIPGYREVVQEGVREQTPDALAAALRDALARGSAQRDLARRRAEAYAWPRVVDALEECFFDAKGIPRKKETEAAL